MSTSERKRSILLLNHPWLADELREIGHRVVSIGRPSSQCELIVHQPEITVQALLEQLPEGFQVESVIYWDDSALPWVIGLESWSVPKIFFSVDIHHHHRWHPQFSLAFDRTLVAQRDYLHHFTPLHDRASWFPLWATRAATPIESKTYPVSFVGTLDARIHPKRLAFLNALAQHVPLELKSGDYRAIYTQSRIVINESVEGDLNFRAFEAMMCGALLVTPRIKNGQEFLFIDGEDLVTYERDNVQDAANKIRYYLERPDTASAIASRGHLKVTTFHSGPARARQISSIVNTLEWRPTTGYLYGAAFSYLSAYIVCQHENFRWGKEFLRRGALTLVESLQSGEPFLRDLHGVVALFLHYLEALDGAGAAIGLLRDVRTHLPEDRTLKLAEIRLLMRTGGQERAMNIAQTISPDAGAICTNVERLLQEALAQ